MIGIEAIEQRKQELSQQLTLHMRRFEQLENEKLRIQAQINGVEGALLDCDYWLQQLNKDTFDETDKNGDAQDGE